jgi:hypothetical protein
MHGVVVRAVGDADEDRRFRISGAVASKTPPFGLMLGPVAQRSNAFAGTSWMTGATLTSTRITVSGASGSIPPS